MGTKYQLGAKLGYPIQIRTPDLHAIRSISSCLKGTFEKIHGNLVQILEIVTQPEALEALVQYYDSPARCFTFTDFQMAPTLEEYERLLGLPLAESVSYFHQDQTPSWGTIARLLKVLGEEMTRVKRNRNGSEGLPRVYLEKRLDLFRVWEDWPAFMDTLRLLIYEILLFPQLEDYEDLIAVGEFLAMENRGENPTMAVLADTYYSLNQCDEQRRGVLRCCTPLLYLWLTAHLFQCKHRMACPVEDFKWSWILPMTKEEWVRKLDEASEKSIRWYPLWNEREHVIIQCEGYPNVLLLGTQGAINYNPELMVRQEGYPIITPPRGSLDTFRTTRAESVKGATKKLRSCGAFPEYRHWAEERETLEVEKLKVSLDKTKAERAHWKRKLEEVLEEIHHEKHLNIDITKKAQAEHDAQLRIGSCLKAADKEMCARRAECDQVAKEKERLEKILLDSQRREDEQREQFRQLQEKIHLLEEELARANLSNEHLKEQGRKSLLELVKTRTKAEKDEAQLKETIQGLREAVEGWKRRCQDIADNAQEQVNVATTETSFWKDRFFKLAWLTNQALKDIPRSLRAVEGMADFMKMPREIMSFLGLCRGLYDQIKARVALP
ncbi:hypothetical protein CR513_04671, partial [Mucuna pruriens]